MKISLNFEFEGKTFQCPVELSSEELTRLKVLASSIPERTGWEKPEEGNTYFYEDALCRVQRVYMDANSAAKIEILHENGNCYSNESLARDIARGDALARKLRRKAAETRSSQVDFSGNGGYTITFNYMDNCIECGITGNWMAFGDIIFETEAIAQEAINENREELIWYFTERALKL